MRSSRARLNPGTDIPVNYMEKRSRQDLPMFLRMTGFMMLCLM